MISLNIAVGGYLGWILISGRFVAPIRRLIGAAQIVSQGNLNVALPERRGEGDLRRLSETFNTMTSELRTQRNELVSTNNQLRDGRAFMEATLAGVTSGVLGLDENMKVTLANRAAERLLKRNDMVGWHSWILRRPFLAYRVTLNAANRGRLISLRSQSVMMSAPLRFD